MVFIKLEQFFKENPSAALGFSGGADSSYLLYAGIKYGAKINAYYVKTAFQPEFELHDAYKLAEHLGAKMTVLEMDVLSDEQVVSNPPDRCYYCKTAIFGTLQKQALADGFTLVIDGTNASDDAGDRPGMKALAELSVHSPLKEAGITKNEVRRLSKEAGLFTWDKPSYACLATRIPANREITADLLKRVEKSEDALFALGFTDFRARVFGEAARLQFTREQMNEATNKRADIIQALKPYFKIVLLDLEERQSYL
ncbi:MAG: ATP-dependent sacrificial sulfur transferase LarE [Oscillospiraceae bacterium]|nr:ATP-dependent sacrificial sulfur transferase LarE [Oscillospiraceae bacterium]